MSTDTTYNGWKNYETWNVKLWMDNDGSDRLQELAEDAVRRAIDGQGNPYADNVRDSAAMLMADDLKDETENAMQDMLEQTGQQSSMWADLLGAALSEVDWREIADNVLSDVEIYSAGWNMPGCLPESDPAVFTDADDALEYIKNQARESVDQDFDSDDMTEETAEALTAEVDAWTADKSGEFGAIFRNTSYWVSKI